MPKDGKVKESGRANRGALPEFINPGRDSRIYLGGRISLDYEGSDNLVSPKNTQSNKKSSMKGVVNQHDPNMKFDTEEEHHGE